MLVLHFFSAWAASAVHIRDSPLGLSVQWSVEKNTPSKPTKSFFFFLSSLLLWVILPLCALLLYLVPISSVWPSAVYSNTLHWSTHSRSTCANEVPLRPRPLFSQKALTWARLLCLLPPVHRRVHVDKLQMFCLFTQILRAVLNEKISEERKRYFSFYDVWTGSKLQYVN